MPGPSDRIIFIYQRHALAWDQDRSRQLFEKAWLDRFLALMPASASVLDIGCGSAEPLARYLIAQGCSITGIDTSPGLLALAEQRFPSQTWIEADMRTLCLQRSFDGMLAWDSFFHLTHDDQRGMFAIFRQHSRPGTALMFTSGPAHGEAIGNYRGEPLYHASLDAVEYWHLLETEGFEVVAHRAEDAGCGGHTIWLARRR